ncbi:MAG: hypothetical protein ABL308_06410 [Oceanicaulis sp.]
MKRLIMIAAAAAVLAGCATAEGYRQQVEQFVGAHSDAILLEWGPPVARDQLSDGSEIWVYFNEERRYDPGGYRSIPRERRITYYDDKGNERTRVEQYEDTVYEPPREWWTECETRFVIGPDSRVRDFRFSGDACLAEEIY